MKKAILTLIGCLFAITLHAIPAKKSTRLSNAENSTLETLCEKQLYIICLLESCCFLSDQRLLSMISSERWRMIVFSSSLQFTGLEMQPVNPLEV